MTTYERMYGGGWRDKPDTSTPIDAAALNHLEVGILGAYDAAAAAGVSIVDNGDGTATVTPGVPPAPPDFAYLARNPDGLVSGAVTRDGNGAALSAPVTWPDGVTGLYAADTVSSAFPGAVDAYHVTYGSPTVLHTYSQPLITRDATGAPVNVPAIVVT